MSNIVTIDGNQAAARIAHLTNEVIAIYPITPASPMGEWADDWSSRGIKNLWGNVPEVIEMQSEAGAAGAVHGALQAGALTTTFTASQGLLLMIPNMYKIAGELTPMVLHVAARSIASQALSIFGEHSDVMATRATGFAMLASNSPQEVADMALIAQAATLESRIPILHFFDGFRTSHEVAKLAEPSVDVIRQMIDEEKVNAHRLRGMSPLRPSLRGSSQNPDVFFQGRESVNPYYGVMPDVLQECMDRFAHLTGRQYKLFDYVGAKDATRVVVIMGSGAETAHETVEHLCAQGEKVGVLKVRLYRPFSANGLLGALPKTVNSLAVLDRTKEPGADGEPLYKDVLGALAQAFAKGDISAMPKVSGGRYGLSSKEFTPGMVKAIFDELSHPYPKQEFTIGIHDDVTYLSLPWDESYRTQAHEGAIQAVFYGLGSDGTVSANKNSIKIIGEQTDLYAQGYFVYDSKKSGAVTVSHLRFGPQPIRSSYLIGDGDAQFVACHQPVFLERYPMLDMAAKGAVFLLNTPHSVDSVWNSLPTSVQKQLIQKQIRFYCIDAYGLAQRNGMGKRINTIMQTCFFAISGVLPKQDAIAAIKGAVAKTYGKKGKRIVEMNEQAIDYTLACLFEVPVPTKLSNVIPLVNLEVDKRFAKGPSFVQEVTAELIAGRGDRLPVSKFPADGCFPVGTAAYEKRNLALEIPVWDEDLCTQCGKCVLVCPHSAIRSKIVQESELVNAPQSFKHKAMIGKGFPQGDHISYQVAPEDCTGCSLCVDICPIRDKSNASHKALNMAPQPPLREQEKVNWDYFLSLPSYDRSALKASTIKGAMAFDPLFEFSGACSGCGETPYIRLASQLFGDRMLVANATGCSSIYGGNLPTTPWTKNAEGRGPAWNNSLFEDNAEFGLGMRLAIDQQRHQALELLQMLAPELDGNLVSGILNADETTEAGIFEQRQRIDELNQQLTKIGSLEAQRLQLLSENLTRKSVWCIGGDGWAYDIGYGGLDHVLASGKNVNILVLDTEVYSNTGGQTSKATPRGAVAKFSAGGKANGKKDLALLAMDYGNVYVAHLAYGAKDVQTLRAFLEAEAHDGPSLLIAYAPCIAHGVDLSNNHRQQNLAVNSGHWPLFRYDPAKATKGQNPLHLDSAAPSVPYKDFVKSETRFNMLWQTHPVQAEALLAQAQQEVEHRFHYYQQLAELDWSDPVSIAATKLQTKSPAQTPTTESTSKEQPNG
ncbi:pyruvate:ferredoxin (flavodoxin) oxidoreductase [Maribrevibacterium harenarium]|uniref:Pyruvate-flavodoxin oxidoreductase n=1 Tax=Maribrevibacterium harenarium TaxID=2589817 RepID=A0A501WUJ4_9GAMM|nr:pyruvate:ferredoxin (flavodoxin) oxidoreductase [Maribrevibacterium harenarium]TPE51834.1 pyruvate:ferredoxin (flavodoxin) oxidoreductase [Maribrevibacterium harenarium]